jgi:hypothetical protein
MKHNILPTSKQNLNSVQNIISGDHPFYDSQKELKGEFASKPRGIIWVESGQRRWFSRWSDREAGPGAQCPKDTQI